MGFNHIYKQEARILHGDGIAEMLQVYILLPQQQLILLQHQHFQQTPHIP